MKEKGNSEFSLVGQNEFFDPGEIVSGSIYSGTDWSQRVELNHRPTDYESVALPLSYAGNGFEED